MSFWVVGQWSPIDSSKQYGLLLLLLVTLQNLIGRPYFWKYYILELQNMGRPSWLQLGSFTYWITFIVREGAMHTTSGCGEKNSQQSYPALWAAHTLLCSPRSSLWESVPPRSCLAFPDPYTELNAGLLRMLGSSCHSRNTKLTPVSLMFLAALLSPYGLEVCPDEPRCVSEREKY